MTRISTFTYEGQDVEILVHKGKISYVFEVEGKRYGNAVQISGRSQQDVVTASFNLILNFLETKAMVNKAKI